MIDFLIGKEIFYDNEPGIFCGLTERDHTRAIIKDTDGDSLTFPIKELYFIKDSGTNLPLNEFIIQNVGDIHQFPAGTSYKEREETLKLIQFEDYETYRNSDRWREIKAYVYQEKGDKCMICGGTAQVIHHTRYHVTDLLGLCSEHLHPLCHKCHELVEMDPRWGKRTMAAAFATFRKLLNSNDSQSNIRKHSKKLVATSIPKASQPAEYTEGYQSTSQLYSEVGEIRFLLNNLRKKLETRKEENEDFLTMYGQICGMEWVMYDALRKLDGIFKEETA